MWTNKGSARWMGKVLYSVKTGSLFQALTKVVLPKILQDLTLLGIAFLESKTVDNKSYYEVVMDHYMHSTRERIDESSARASIEPQIDMCTKDTDKLFVCLNVQKIRKIK